MPNTAITPEEFSAYMESPILQAFSERGQIVPVVGAGISRGIGLPNWQELASALARANPEGNRHVGGNLAVLDDAHNQLARSHYEKLIQRQLDTPENKTSLAHQALVSARVSRIVTTNLDFALERAYEMAGMPLRPENVIVGPAHIRIPVRSGPTLYKIHGSLEDPASWVLRSDEYDRAYRGNGATLQWWRDLQDPLLFIGFSFADEDVGSTLKVLEVERSVGSYAIMHLEQIRRQSQTLKRMGIRPIAYLDVRQVPELIDEIFRSDGVRTTVVTDPFRETRQVRVGASVVDIPITATSQQIQEVSRTLANALEFGAPETSGDRTPRRLFGERGQFISLVQRWALQVSRRGETNREGEIDAPVAEQCLAVVRGLLFYPDVLLDQFLPGVVTNPKINARILTLIWDHADDWIKSRIKRYALSLLDRPLLEDPPRTLETAAIRGLAIFLADTVKAHPAMRMAPITDAIPGAPQLRVCRYPLTRFQVCQLRKTLGPVVHAIRPFTLGSLDEAEAVVRQLNESYSSLGKWRLPTDEEWRLFALPPNQKWPWGDANPQRGVHAHLTFSGTGGPITKHPMEVGTFSGDITGGGPIRDLIGNVYELVRKADGSGWALAGGGWTTAYRTAAAPTLISNYEAEHRQQNNIGLRLIVEIC